MSPATISHHLLHSSGRVAFGRSLRGGASLLRSPAWNRSLSTKHPKGFVSPTDEELVELRERVQEFTRRYIIWAIGLTSGSDNVIRSGREIPEEVAARTDQQNEFPPEMWRKLGEAGYGTFFL
jgi:isovaleryl-CoA dehydrogenase